MLEHVPVGIPKESNDPRWSGILRKREAYKYRGIEELLKFEEAKLETH